MIWPYYVLMWVGPTSRIRCWAFGMMVLRWLQKRGIECEVVKE